MGWEVQAQVHQRGDKRYLLFPAPLPSYMGAVLVTMAGLGKVGG